MDNQEDSWLDVWALTLEAENFLNTMSSKAGLLTEVSQHLDSESSRHSDILLIFS